MAKRLSLPPLVRPFVEAHAALVQSLSSSGLKFTLDGRLVGDIAEIVAVEAYGLTFPEKRTPGVDAFANFGTGRKSVQIKASGIGEGPAFTAGEGSADQLLFLSIDFFQCTADVVYNGPEAPVRAQLPRPHTGTKRVNISILRALDDAVSDFDRLQLVRGRNEPQEGK